MSTETIIERAGYMEKVGYIDGYHGSIDSGVKGEKNHG